jgi:anti-sigma factor RsiW
MSIHPEILDLIQAEIDGIATEAEQRRLRNAMAADPAVHEEYRRLRGLCDVLAGIPAGEPPARLAPSVMRAIRSRRHEAARGVTARILAFWPGGRVALRYGYALAAGIVIGVLGVHLASGGSRFGAAVREGDAGATIAPARGASRLDLQPAGIQGSATLSPSASGASIGLDLKATEPVAFVLTYDPSTEGDDLKVVIVRNGVATEAGSLRLSPAR